jgi:hypothetical protein
MGTLAETQEAITTELRYQSSLDLSYETYAAIRHLPLARDVSQHARQQASPAASRAPCTAGVGALRGCM